MTNKVHIKPEKIQRYTDCINSIILYLRANKLSSVGGNFDAICKKHRCAQNTIKYSVLAGILTRNGHNTYKINVVDVHPIHVRKVIEGIMLNDRQKQKEINERRKANGGVLIRKRKPKSTPKKTILSEALKMAGNKQKINAVDESIDKCIAEVKKGYPQLIPSSVDEQLKSAILEAELRNRKAVQPKLQKKKVSILWGLISWSRG